MKKLFDILAFIGWGMGLVLLGIYIWLTMPYDTNARGLTASYCQFNTFSTVRGFTVFHSGSCVIDGVGWTQFGSGMSVGGSFSTTTDMNNFMTDQYGTFGFCTMSGCSGSWSAGANTWTCSGGMYCPAFGTQALLRTGPKGDKGDTGATGATGIGATGATGMPGLDAYEIAVIMGFTGTISEWLLSLKGDVGATGSIDFSTFSGALNLINEVNIPDNNAELAGSGRYFSLLLHKNGSYYLDMDGIRNIIMYLAIVFIIIILLIWVFRQSRKSL